MFTLKKWQAIFIVLLCLLNALSVVRLMIHQVLRREFAISGNFHVYPMFLSHSELSIFHERIMQKILLKKLNVYQGDGDIYSGFRVLFFLL